jgi:outer membrane protein assembly factor BamB
MRLQKGPAYGESPTSSFRPTPSDWPAFRHDARRSGITTTHVPNKLAKSWQRQIGGKLTSPVAAGGKVFVASTDSHSVHAIDSSSGAEVWDFTAGGRIDSPPTIYNGLALFGSADGSVYAVSG